jgi:hypothetical protein
VLAFDVNRATIGEQIWAFLWGNIGHYIVFSLQNQGVFPLLTPIYFAYLYLSPRSFSRFKFRRFVCFQEVQSFSGNQNSKQPVILITN